MKYNNGSDFLNKMYSDMHMEDIVMHTAYKDDKPSEKIEKYLDRLERVHNKARVSEFRMNVLKSYYYDKYVIKKLPDNYIELQRKINNTKSVDELLEQVQNDQKESLDIWIDYLVSDEANYPMWFKSYVFQGMLKLNRFDKDTLSFGRRTDSTTHPFIELNEEIISSIYDLLNSEIGNMNIDNEAEKVLSKGESFKKLYTYYFTKNMNVKKENNDDGIWIKYEKGKDSRKLCDSIQGKNTGWCIAGYDTAKNILDNNDMYVYYTKDSVGEFREPRVAIRVENDNVIGEIRGILQLEEVEDSMLDVIDEKIEEFKNKDEYRKKVNDMRRISELSKKKDLNIDDLIFIYGIDSDVESFGGHLDPRVERLKIGRSLVEDLNNIFKVRNEVSGSLFLKGLTNIEKLNIPDRVCNLYIPDVVSTSNLKLPTIIDNNLNLSSIKSSEGLVLPEKIGGCLNLSSLEDAENLKLPEKMGSLNLASLNSIKDLKLPKEIEGDLILSSITSLEGNKLPEKIGGSLILSNLTDTTGLKLPKKLDGDLYLNSVEYLDNIELPEKIDGTLCLRKVKSLEGVRLPKRVGGSIFADGLKSIKGVLLPEEVGYQEGFFGKLFLDHLEDQYMEIPLSYMKNNIRIICPNTKLKYVNDEEYFKKNIIVDNKGNKNIK